MEHLPNFNKNIDKETKKLLRKFAKFSKTNSYKRIKDKSIPRVNMLTLLFNHFGKCFWCDEEVFDLKLDGGKPPFNMATIDHVRSRYFREKGDDVLKVLSCFRCNAKRCDFENKKYGNQHRLKKLYTPKDY